MPKFYDDGSDGVMPKHETWPVIKRFLPFVKPYQKTIVLIAVLMVVALPLSAVAPLIVKHLINVIVPSRDLARMFLIGGVLIGLALLDQSLACWQAVLSKRVELKVLNKMRLDLFAHMIRLPMSFFTRHSTGYLMSRQRDDLRHLSGVMADTVLRAGISGVRAVVFIGLLFYLDFVLALTGLGLVLLFVAVNQSYSKPLRRRNQLVQEAIARTSTSLHEAIIGISLIKATAREKTETRYYTHLLNHHTRASFRRDLLEVFATETIELFAKLGLYSIVLIGAYRIIVGATTFGDLMAFFMALTTLFTSLTSLMKANQQLQRAMNALQRIYEVFDTPQEPASKSFPKLKPASCAIVFENVSFSYAPDTPVLRQITATIPAGAQVALVGPSGTGKSTFASLIPRFYDPTHGRILMNGVDLKEINLYSLRRLIGIVPQDVFLFDRTIHENIAYGTGISDRHAIEEAARAANAHEFILNFPKGYDTRIGERGVRISVGQKQRLAIAREILRNPPILILDEATSSLDSASEALIQEALHRFKQNRTSVVIAHRLSTVIEADWILVFDKGRIIEQGRHEDLLAHGGFYAFLFETQFKRGQEAMEAVYNAGENGRRSAVETEQEA